MWDHKLEGFPYSSQQQLRVEAAHHLCKAHYGLSSSDRGRKVLDRRVLGAFLLPPQSNKHTENKLKEVNPVWESCFILERARFLCRRRFEN